MQTRVRLNNMLQSVEDMMEIKKKLNAYESELAQIRWELTALSGMEQPINQICQCEKKIVTEIQNSILFGSTLTSICRQYEIIENKLVDYSENTRRMAMRESFSKQNLRELYELFNKVLL